MFSRASLGASCLAVLAILTIAAAPASGADFRSIPLAGGEPRVEVVSESLESLRLTVEVGELVAMEWRRPRGPSRACSSRGSTRPTTPGVPSSP